MHWPLPSTSTDYSFCCFVGDISGQLVYKKLKERSDEYVARGLARTEESKQKKLKVDYGIPYTIIRCIIFR